jgi:hypothetical protein
VRRMSASLQIDSRAKARLATPKLTTGSAGTLTCSDLHTSRVMHRGCNCTSMHAAVCEAPRNKIILNEIDV